MESADITPRWSLEDDIAFLREEAAPRSVDGAALLPYLVNASERDSYSSSAEALSESSGSCAAWMVFQAINVNANEFNATLLCKQAGSWSMLTGGHFPEEILGADAKALDGLLGSFTNEIVDAGCDPILDASAVYITAFVGDRVLRQAVYAPTSIVGGCRDSLGSRQVVANLDVLHKLIDGDHP